MGTYMIVQTTKPFTKAQIKQAQEQFGSYIKTVIDVKRQICVAGMDRHFEGEKLLLDDGSNQSDIWGGGIDRESKEVDCNSFINIRPNDNNTSNEIQDKQLRETYIQLTQKFFQEVI
jgi:hypothetical protein